MATNDAKITMKPLHIDFFRQPTLELANALLGKRLVHQTDRGTCSGIIVETEAYLGPMDRAAHSFGNRRTARTEIMFGSPGFAYVYLMHTHALLNVVSSDIEPHAVLIRALQPEHGLAIMQQRRPKISKPEHLSNGPGKLTKAMGITIADYGKPLWEPPLFIAEGIEVEHISAGPRIGIPNTGEAKAYPWRYWITGNPFVSR
jgi:DNA-3-methyladenine glycosylase